VGNSPIHHGSGKLTIYRGGVHYIRTECITMHYHSFRSFTHGSGYSTVLT